ncbi:hypothetical protein DSO57_1018299 [Entomophthora muscae]|uniref:Uncharacterized protein n=1 Tax=Entomophthora muscae TaxID=34485 RepID=A0ACC2UQX8_9FUNG|nr:hypothetical protein DSO57_1018299 [Entomophthora muscae]
MRILCLGYSLCVSPRAAHELFASRHSLLGSFPLFLRKCSYRFDIHFSNTIYQTPFLNYYGSAFLMFELSTPFLNLVYFMVTTIHGFGFEFASVFISNLFLQDKCSYSKTLLFKLNGIVLLLVFFLVRIVFGLYMSVKTFESVITEGYRAPLHLMALYGSANVALNLLNQLWFYKLVCLFIRKLNYYDRSLTSPHSSPAKNVSS